MVVGQCCRAERWSPPSGAHGPPESLDRQAPPPIRMLEWDAERMRSRSHQPQHGGSGAA